jgi:hypothetical protein
MKTNRIIKFVFPVLVFVLTSAYFSCDNPTGPLEDTPGRRDYVWELDTLNMPANYLGAVWGASPNDVWAGGAGGTEYDRLWHYDGNKWKVYNKEPIYCTVETIYGFDYNNVWMGGGDEPSSGAAIWHYDGSRWTRNYVYNVSGEYATEVTDIWGLAPNNIYACGTISYKKGTIDSFQGFVLHYDGTGWTEVSKGDTNYQFDFIRSEYNYPNSFLNLGYKSYTQAFKYSIINSDSSIFAFYELEGSNLKKIYSNTGGNIHYTSLSNIDGTIYFLINQDVYEYTNGEFNKQFSLESPNFGYQFWGRNLQDIFVRMMDGIAHYNGADIRYLYKFSPSISETNRPLILKNDIFFMIWDGSGSQITNEILHGKLK